MLVVEQTAEQAVAAHEEVAVELAVVVSVCDRNRM